MNPESQGKQSRQRQEESEDSHSSSEAKQPTHTHEPAQTSETQSHAVLTSDSLGVRDLTPLEHEANKTLISAQDHNMTVAHQRLQGSRPHAGTAENFPAM